MDLTPYYGFAEDAVHFHRTCQEALAPFGADTYQRYKKWCDDYFYLKHRQEPRGIGGIFYDDLNDSDFDRCFALTQSVGDRFLDAYAPVLERRKDMPFGARERDSSRIAVAVTSNSIWSGIAERCSGLQSNGRTEAILMSMPPVAMAVWWMPAPGTPEAQLYEFLVVRDWAPTDE